MRHFGQRAIFWPLPLLAPLALAQAAVAAVHEQRPAHHAVAHGLAGAASSGKAHQSDRPSNGCAGTLLKSKFSRQRALTAAVGLPARSTASAKGCMPQIGQK